MESGCSNWDPSCYFSVCLGKFLCNIFNKPSYLLMELSNRRPKIAQGFEKVGGSKIEDMAV